VMRPPAALLALLLAFATPISAIGATDAVRAPGDCQQRRAGHQTDPSHPHTHQLHIGLDSTAHKPGSEPGGRLLTQAQLDSDHANSTRTGRVSRALLASKKVKGRRRPARSGAYVSLGKVRSFKGDVYPTPSLALALENRSFK
jgi:hypothetical protein